MSSDSRMGTDSRPTSDPTDRGNICEVCGCEIEYAGQNCPAIAVGKIPTTARKRTAGVGPYAKLLTLSSERLRVNGI
jgi:hypothetical protein